jgi:SPX domain protein involved in polyphosphate accumulation
MTSKSDLAELKNYRYERKFVVSGLSYHEIESIINLHPAMFSEVYSPRFVNNLYFDSPGMNQYFNNIDGLMERVKVRIRWYGELFGHVDNPTLELKFKRGLVGRKMGFPLPEICIDGFLQKDILLNTLKQSDVPDNLKLDLVSLEFALINRYWRKYFQSVDDRYRITLDTKLESYYVQGHSNTFLHKSIDRNDSVVELKYGPQEDDRVGQICQHFPFRLTKNSKYVNGIESLTLW